MNGITSTATAISATANETRNIFCTLCNGLYVNIAQMTIILPTIVNIMIAPNKMAIKMFLLVLKYNMYTSMFSSIDCGDGGDECGDGYSDGCGDVFPTELIRLKFSSDVDWLNSVAVSVVALLASLMLLT